MAGTFEVFKNGEQFYFRLRARNGRIILASEPYASKASAAAGVASVKTNAADDTHYERTEGRGGFRFVLKAEGGEQIGRSEVFTTSAWCESGVASVKATAPKATVEDRT